MEKTLFVIFFVWAVFSVDALSQVEENNPPDCKEVGVNIGPTTGIGLSYRQWIGNNGFQLTALPVKTDNTTFISGGISLLHSFKHDPNFRFFGYIGHHVFRYRGTGEDFNNLFPSPLGDVDFYKPEEQLDFLHYNIGAGVGISMGSIVGFNAQLGYGAFDVLGSFNLYPTGEIGLFYRF